MKRLRVFGSWRKEFREKDVSILDSFQNAIHAYLSNSSLDYNPLIHDPILMVLQNNNHRASIVLTQLACFANTCLQI